MAKITIKKGVLPIEDIAYEIASKVTDMESFVIANRERFKGFKVELDEVEMTVTRQALEYITTNKDSVIKAINDELWERWSCFSKVKDIQFDKETILFCF